MFLTVDPALSDPFNLIESPELQASYAYAGSNAIRYTDPSGALFTIAKANDVVRAAWDKSDAAKKLDGFAAALGAAGSFRDAGMAAGKANHLPKSFVKLGVGMDRAAAKEWQDTAEVFEPNPLIDIDPSTGSVTLGAPYGKRKELGSPEQTTSSQTPTTDNASSGGTPAVNSSQSSNASSTSSGAGNSAQSSATPTSQPQSSAKAKAAPKPLPKRPKAQPPTSNN